MTSQAVESPLAAPAKRRPRLLGLARSNGCLFLIGTTLFAAIIIVSLISPFITPHDPAAQSLLRRLAAPSTAHWLGTDQLGRDVFSRLLCGGRFALAITLVTLSLSCIIGTVIGVAAARAGKTGDEVAMRTVDLLLCFPEIIVAIFLTALLGTGYATLILALTIVGWTPFARLARGLALDINRREFVRAAEVLGCSRSFIIFRHIIPNVFRPIAAMLFLRFGHKLIAVGGLSFIGLGVQPPNPDWAAMMAEAQPYSDRAPWLIAFPGLAIFLTALSVTWIGQGFDFDSRREAI
jgi:peptide/nickel transport system permease protein